MTDRRPSSNARSPPCRNCQYLDFEQIVNNRTVPTTGIEIINIGKKATSKLKAACDLCCFLHKLGPGYTKNFAKHLRLFTSIEQPYIYDTVSKKYCKTGSQIPQHPFFCVLRRNARLAYDHNIEAEVRSAGLVCYIPHENPTAFQLCSVDPTCADWKAIAHQLDYCSQQHPTCQQDDAATSRLLYIFLIDCATGSIVKGSLSDRFMALSYVWGPQHQQLEFAFADSFSLQNAPLTVQDAVKAVLKLGRRYLWVDRYCINQQDESEKKMMIDNMDLIYESSEATLVALYGEHDGSGLPGVSTLSRDTQPIFDTSTGQLIHSFPDIRSLIENSKWNTRGWTYQEARLSRRCLFFSHYQVYLVCRHSTWSEAVPFEPSINSVTKVLNSQKLDSTLFGVDIYKDYWRDRLEFSKRNLSRETDGLNAFRGILRRSSFISLWGIPVTPQTSDIDPNVGFSLGLLWTKRPGWQGTGHLQNRQAFRSSRRFGFPTWSWTSLHADICQDSYGPQSNYGKYLVGISVCFPVNEANIRFWCIVHGHPISLQDAIATTNSPILPEYSRELHVEGDFIKLCRNSRGGCKLFGEWRYCEEDLLDENYGSRGASTEDCAEIEIEALVLIEWEDAQKRNGMKRFVLMLVHWTDENHAERIGLLTQYRDEFRRDLIDQLPRVRKRRFILQ